MQEHHWHLQNVAHQIKILVPLWVDNPGVRSMGRSMEGMVTNPMHPLSR